MYSPYTAQRTGDKSRYRYEVINKQTIKQLLERAVSPAEGMPVFVPDDLLAPELRKKRGPISFESKVSIDGVNIMITKYLAEEMVVSEQVIL
jgi:hypothetical protein